MSLELELEIALFKISISINQVGHINKNET